MKPLSVREVLRDILAIIACMIALILSHAFQLPVSSFPPLDLQWITVIVLSLLFTNRFVPIALATGCLICGFLPIIQIDLPLESRNKILFQLIYAFCLWISATSVRKALNVRSWLFCLIMMFFLISLGGWILLTGITKIGIIFYSACVITGCLTCMKNSNLGSYPSRFFFAWLPGYLVLIVTMSILRLDPTGVLSGGDAAYRYFLVPFPVYMLEILIASHLTFGLLSEKNESINN